jgi:SAM-dependent methyltransferase
MTSCAGARRQPAEPGLAEALPAVVPVDESATCPACGAAGLAIFHEQHEVPVHSCLLVTTREEAEAFPRGSLRLGLCSRCGFITNVDFDASLQSYNAEYEETQGFSPRFRQFIDELAERWIERYDLRGKDVVEIGCGKAEFLTLLCERGVRRGIGIDPAAAPERLSGPAADRVELVREVYSERFGALGFDAVVCRHTLEHIGPVAQFVSVIRRSLEAKPGTPVLFEVPDAMRILREGAFWDIYYEHCSYFTRGSLARLFRASGFDVLTVELAYDDQYIVLEARPGAGDGDVATGEETPAATEQAAADFKRGLADAERRWRGTVDELRATGKRAAVWGSGSKGVAFLTTLRIGDEIGCVVDINPYRQGMFMAGTGHEIVGPEFLRKYRPDLVIAMNPIYLDEIGRDLERMGLDAELTAV